jgi:hypothetical protein
MRQIGKRAVGTVRCMWKQLRTGTVTSPGSVRKATVLACIPSECGSHDPKCETSSRPVDHDLPGTLISVSFTLSY